MNRTVDKPSYFKYIVSRSQILDWLVMTFSVILGCLFMVRYYPFPAIISDAYGYLSCALNGSFIPYRPYGYSAFLRFIHSLSDSPFVIVASNASVYLLSLGLLLLAIKKYWSPSRRWIFIAFEVLTILSPLAIFMLDTIMSDSLFCSLVFFMLAMILVMVQEKSTVAAILFLPAFYFSLDVRYSAVFLPLAFIPVLICCRKHFFNILAIVGIVTAVLVFNKKTSERMYDCTGIKQSSTGFGGWQLANNGLHVIPFIDENDKTAPKDPELLAIHKYCMAYKPMISQKTHDGNNATAVFMWSNDSPLKQILFFYCERNRTAYLTEWARLGDGLFSQYGKWLILHYPGKFLRHYLWPNMKQMVFPTSMEIAGNTLDIQADKKEIADYFDIPGNFDLTQNAEGFRKNVTPLLPYLEMATWILFLLSVIAIMWRRTLSTVPTETGLILLLLFLTGFIYYGTTTFASPIAIRYWMPMHAVKMIFVWVAFNHFLSQKYPTFAE